MTDWGRGSYEVTAERLVPAAVQVAERLDLRPGQRVLDVACGTGNAAIELARAGASAIGVDQAERLVALAADRAAAEGVDAQFLVGDATALGFGDASFDAAVSIFGVIFADMRAAADELLRVTRPGGRIVLTTWTTGGATAKVMEAIRETLGGPPKPPVWSDPEVVGSFFPPGTVTFEEEVMAFRAASAAAYVTEHEESHPVWLELRPAVEASGKAEELRSRVLAIYEDANEDRAGFLLPVPYRIVTVRVPER